MPVQKLKEFLDGQKVKYVVVYHSPAYTAQEIAGSAHIPGRQLAKTTMVKVDGRMAMAVLPADMEVSFEMLREEVSSGSAELASEAEFRDLFPQCELGAMPPFGNLYDMDVFVDPLLTEDYEIAFNAGSHRELIKIAYADFETLVQPKVLSFAVKT